jgi:hypothetical protein
MLNAMTTPHRRTVEIDVALAPETDSAEDVSLLVSRILRDIDRCSADHQMSQSDVLQALTIATAVHAAKAQAEEDRRHPIGLEFLDADVRPAGAVRAVA